MTPELYQRVREIYHAACDVPRGAQSDLLLNLCAGDLELLTEVQSLLGYHDDRDDALSDSQLGIGSRLLNAAGADHAGIDDPAAEADFPARIGRYRLLKRIGEGGMGIVFEAVQDYPSRNIALKLIRVGFGSKSLLRFKHEAEMLGRLRHPGIVHVYEAGIHYSPAGAQIPYMAMELIQGVPLEEYARQQELGTRGRLALFAQICDAVEHAHQRGVIHRDLKPRNVLVDAGGQPKVFDFGIARATEADLRTTTLHTSTGQLLGTVHYMSPEQASGDPTAIDTRSDVYSLGVILYELLTGRLPYEMENRSIADAVRIIRDTEPTRISVVDRSYRGDIETLLSKALEKEKRRRYGSPGELGADVRRYLADLPLVARPASALYQLRKFTRRHRALVTAAGLCLLLLVGGGIGTTTGLISAMHANRQLAHSVLETTALRDQARESERKATSELARTRQVIKVMRSMLRAAHPAVARGRDTTLLREVLENTVAKMDAGELGDQPSVEAEIRATISETYNGIGDNAAALRVIEPAIQLARAAPPDQSHQFLQARVFYATALVVWGRDAQAKAEFEQCLKIQNSGVRPEDELAGVLYSNFGGHLATLGDTEVALELHGRALDLRRRLMGERHADVAASLGNTALCLKDLKRYEESLAMMQDALSIYEQANPPRWLHLTILKDNIADLLLRMDRPAQAELMARDSLELGRRIYTPEHQQMGTSTHTLGRALRAQDRHEEARECFARAVETLTVAFDEQHRSVATARMDLGIELTRLGCFAEAEDELLAAQAVLSEATGPLDTASADCSNALLRLYDEWDQAEPGTDHDAPDVAVRIQLHQAISPNAAGLAE